MKLNTPFQKSIQTPAADASMNGGGGSGASGNGGVSGAPIDQETAEGLDQRANAAFDVLVEKLGADLVPALEALAQKDAGTLKSLFTYLN